MYLKLSAKNEEFQLLFLDEEGLEFNPGLPLSIKLFNKIGYSSKMTLSYSSFKELMMNIDDELTDEEIKYVVDKIAEFVTNER